MPLQIDSSKPVKTVDSKGNTLSVENNGAPPIKTVDVQNRVVESVPYADAPANSQEAQNIAKIEGQEPIPKNPDQEARKLYLQAQKAKRRADELEKKAGDSLKQAEAFQKAKALAESGEDPTALLLAAGLDPIKYYRDMTTFALSDKAKTPEDPVKKELREHKERLDQYAKDLEVQATTIKQKEEVAAHNEVITKSVIPLLNSNPDKYETLLMEYGANAAVEVYKTVWEIYQTTGKARKFDEVADEMEKYWADKVEAGINSAYKLKKFSNRFAQQTNQETNRNPKSDHQETTNRSPTLSNKHNTTPLNKNSTQHVQQSKTITRDERVAEILKKFGI